MELLAYLVASIVISNYLERKSKIGNVAFSILFVFVSGFYLVVSRRFLALLPANGQMLKYLLIIHESVDSTFGLTSAGAVVRSSMLATVIVACAYGAYMVLSLLKLLLTRVFTKTFVQSYVRGDLCRIPNLVSSNVVEREAPIAKTRTYIKFGVLRN